MYEYIYIYLLLPSHGIPVMLRSPTTCCCKAAHQVGELEDAAGGASEHDGDPRIFFRGAHMGKTMGNLWETIQLFGNI